MTLTLTCALGFDLFGAALDTVALARVGGHLELVPGVGLQAGDDDLVLIALLKVVHQTFTDVLILFIHLDINKYNKSECYVNIQAIHAIT